MTDLGDILFHAGVAAMLCLFGWVFLDWPYGAAGVVATGFAAREAWQDREKTGRWRAPSAWSTQKKIEAGAPLAVAAAFALAAAVA